MRDFSTAWAVGVVAVVMVLAATRHALAALSHPEQRAGRIVQVVALGVAVGCLVVMVAGLPEAGREEAPAYPKVAGASSSGLARIALPFTHCRGA